MYATSSVDDDNIVGYRCPELMESKETKAVTVEFYYDMIWKKDVGEGAVESFERDLLDRVATRFGLIDGTACSGPPVSLSESSTSSSLWFGETTSIPPDERLTTLFDSCLDFVPPSEDYQCSVYRGMMRGYLLSHHTRDSMDFQNYVQEEVIQASTKSSELLDVIDEAPYYAVSFLGNQLDEGYISGIQEGNLKPAQYVSDALMSKNLGDGTDPADVSFSPLGIFIMWTLILTVLAFFYVVVVRKATSGSHQRILRTSKQHEQQQHDSTNSDDDNDAKEYDTNDENDEYAKECATIDNTDDTKEHNDDDANNKNDHDDSPLDLELNDLGLTEEDLVDADGV